MRRKLIICLFLIVAILLVFGQVRNYDFISWDDLGYVRDNPAIQAGLSWKSVVWAFNTTHAGLWLPVTWLSFILDYELYGLNAGGYHLTNLLLHLANTLLLFLVLKRMTGALYRSAFVAALFALHPLHVESVAWVTERKDVLSTLFWMLTLWAYGRYVDRPSLHRYLLALLAFSLGLMAKPMLVSLPFVLLLLDYWPFDRLQYGQVYSSDVQARESIDFHGKRLLYHRLLLEKVPFFIFSAACSVVTFFAQKSANAVVSLDGMSVSTRFANALVSYVKYMGKMVWPRNLAVLYPHPGDSLPLWQILGAGLLLTAISVLVLWAARRHHRYLAVGWLWYLGTLVPVIGLVQVGLQAMADRFTYVPLIGLFIVIAWGVPELMKRYGHRQTLLAVGSMAVIVGLSISSWFQVRYWKNSITLYEHAIQVTTNSYLPHLNLGVALFDLGKIDEAISHYQEVLRIKPNSAEVHNNLGVAVFKLGKTEAAIAHYLRAIQLEPQYAEAHNNLGNALAEQEKLNEAISHYSQALKIRPTYVNAHNNLGVALARQGRFDEAIARFKKALELQPDYIQARDNLEIALQDKANGDERLDLKPKP